MKLCSLCILQSKDYKSIIDFPFKLYESKWALRADLCNHYLNDRSYLFSIHPIYGNNIVHEIVYYLSKSTYRHKMYRKPYIWALEILSEEPEFTTLCNSPNREGELALSLLVRGFEDKHSSCYELIKTILERGTTIPIHIMDHAAIELHPLVSGYTTTYHHFQTKLFTYFEEHYPEVISRCEGCNEILDLFEDFDKIIDYIRTDSNRNLIRLTLQHIIIYRERTIELCREDQISDRHRYILTYFYKLLNGLIN